MGERAGVPHLRRAPLRPTWPVHVTCRLRDVHSLRRHHCYRVVRAALAAGCERNGFRVVEFSVMTNHLHLVCEAADRGTLARGLQGLLVRIARRLNRHLDRSGRVFTDRYHDRVLRTPAETRNTLVYVLNNARRHGRAAGRRYSVGWVDPCSSGPDFPGWSGRVGLVRRLDDEPPLPRARSWLLRHGWRLAGPIRVDEVPASGPGRGRD
jgi:REP element-mobilizing transposase RayT